MSTGYGGNNSGEDYLIYAWHGVEGFSKFGKYTGNGVSDGPFVYTGFKPAWLLVKSNNAANWYLCDAARSTMNPVTDFLHPDRTDADYTNFNPVVISGDATIATDGALTIAANAVEGSMLNNNAISYNFKCICHVILPFSLP